MNLTVRCEDYPAGRVTGDKALHRIPLRVFPTSSVALQIQTSMITQDSVPLSKAEVTLVDTVIFTNECIRTLWGKFPVTSTPFPFQPENEEGTKAHGSGNVL